MLQNCHRKPGSRRPFSIANFDTNNNKSAIDVADFAKMNLMSSRKKRLNPGLPNIEITSFCDEFEMPPLETLSPFDITPVKEDDSVFFMGSITGMTKSTAARGAGASSSVETGTGNKVSSRIKRVLSTPKELSKSGSDRRKSIGNLFKSTSKQS